MIDRPIKVLWLTNNLTPDHAIALGMPPSPRAGWISTLAQALTADGRVHLAIATNVYPAAWGKININGVCYYTVPQPKKKIDAHNIPANLIADYQRVVADFQPDIMHIHGTEYFHGFLSGNKHLCVPTVISIQGIIEICAQHYLEGLPMSALLLKRTLRDWVRMDGLLEQQISWRRRIACERKIFAENQAFIGRTQWDRAHVRKLNPQARYYHCDEMIRKPFHDGHWDICKINRHSIFASSASYPLKGFHVLVKAVAILRNEFPDIIIRHTLANLYPTLTGSRGFLNNCRGGGYARYLNDLIRAEGLEKCIFPLPNLDAARMAREFSMAHVFVLASFIENSPNSLAEAMLIGTPSVASFTGGIPSMVRENETALLFPPGDEAALAAQIRRVFLDDQLVSDLSSNAREISRVRHFKDKIINNLITIYKNEISLANINSLASIKIKEVAY
jgi:glycosyltransferase involved in cell wall biosynthesis